MERDTKNENCALQDFPISFPNLLSSSSFPWCLLFWPGSIRCPRCIVNMTTAIFWAFRLLGYRLSAYPVYFNLWLSRQFINFSKKMPNFGQISRLEDCFLGSLTVNKKLLAIRRWPVAGRCRVLQSARSWVRRSERRTQSRCGCASAAPERKWERERERRTQNSGALRRERCALFCAHFWPDIGQKSISLVVNTSQFLGNLDPSYLKLSILTNFIKYFLWF